MIRRQQITTKTGEKRTYISVLEGYRPGDGTGVKQRTVKNPTFTLANVLQRF